MSAMTATTACAVPATVQDTNHPHDGVRTTTGRIAHRLADGCDTSRLANYLRTGVAVEREPEQSAPVWRRTWTGFCRSSTGKGRPA